MRISMTSLLFAGMMTGQTPVPPPEVDQALRARVDQFFRYHVEGGASLRRAMDMVAEDSKDYYFASGKIQILKYELLGITYNPEFTRATATVKASHSMAIIGQVIETFDDMATTWKIEDGKWVWYIDPSLMSIMPAPTEAGKTSTAPSLPPGLDQPETVAALGESILRGSKIDKKAVFFRWGQPGEDQVVFLNGFPIAQLELAWSKDVPGLSITLDKAELGQGENGVVRFRYNPPAGFDASKESERTIAVSLSVEPFGQAFLIGALFSPR
jgi:hypothetical protein